MIYCPQCGSGMSETTKFCKNCGLPLAQLSIYVQTGGTAPLAAPPAGQPQHPGFFESLTPKQRLVLTIMLMIFSIPVFGLMAGLGGPFQVFGYLAGLAAVLMPVGILLAVIDYRNRLRRLQPPIPAPAQFIEPPAPPQFQPPYQPPQSLPSPQTRPLPQTAPDRSSVVEDETWRLPEKQG